MLGVETAETAPSASAPRLSWSAVKAALLTEGRVNLDRAFLWTPVAFGLGAAAYLEVGVEPALWVLALATGSLAAIWWVCQRWNAPRGLVVLASLAAFGAAGGLAAKIRNDRVAAPLMAGERVVRRVDGFVVDVVSPGAGGPRLLIAPVAVSGLPPERTPRRIRVTIGENQTPAPGQAVHLRAMLGPPPPPAAPGSYDFGRDAWFDSIGGVGFVIGELGTTRLDPPPLRLRLTMAVNAFRWSLAQRILARMGPSSGGIGAAMVTGHEAWITEDQTEAMRASGLAHILSISGLHMAIVGGFVFGAVRLGVAAWPWLALRAPGKKIAAIAGLAAVLGYLVISGAPPPAERSAITASVAFLAILFDRRAITLHGLAVAALLILAMKPETAGEPGFQMSFAATAALVALAESWTRPVKEISTPWWIRWPQAGLTWLAASVAASLVAGLATAPFAMQHFNRVAVWGLPANLAVAPLSSRRVHGSPRVPAARRCASTWLINSSPVQSLRNRSIDSPAASWARQPKIRSAPMLNIAMRVCSSSRISASPIASTTVDNKRRSRSALVRRRTSVLQSVKLTTAPTMDSLFTPRIGLARYQTCNGVPSRRQNTSRMPSSDCSPRNARRAAHSNIACVCSLRPALQWIR